MTTVFIRTIELGLNYRDTNLLSRAGEIVSQNFKEKNLYGRIPFDQIEFEKTVKVWAYPDQYAPEIDKVLVSLTKPKRPRLNLKKVNG